MLKVMVWFAFAVIALMFGGLTLAVNNAKDLASVNLFLAISLSVLSLLIIVTLRYLPNEGVKTVVMAELSTFVITMVYLIVTGVRMFIVM